MKITVETSINASIDVDANQPPEMQRAGWQAILDNFKKYVENRAIRQSC